MGKIGSTGIFFASPTDLSIPSFNLNHVAIQIPHSCIFDSTIVARIIRLPGNGRKGWWPIPSFPPYNILTNHLYKKRAGNALYREVVWRVDARYLRRPLSLFSSLNVAVAGCPPHPSNLSFLQSDLVINREATQNSEEIWDSVSECGGGGVQT